MNKLLFLPSALVFAFFSALNLGMAGTDILTLASAGWSVKASNNFASNPPSLESVQAFERRAFGLDPNLNDERLCQFRFADLRQSGNLSLVMLLDNGGTGGCNSTYILDKTATGFEIDWSDAVFSEEDGIQDINHDGKHELILWAPIASADETGVGCDWPIVVAWTGNGYSEVSGQYRDYYKRYLKSLDEKIAAYSSPFQQASTAADERPDAVPAISGGPLLQSNSSRSGAPSPQVSEAAPTPDPRDYECDMVQATKTQQFLDIRSDRMIAAAIKDSESDDAGNRILAAVLFSLMKTPEAIADLKTLANDADPEVAKTAKDRLSFSDREYPDEYYRQIKKEAISSPTPGL